MCRPRLGLRHEKMIKDQALLNRLKALEPHIGVGERLLLRWNLRGWLQQACQTVFRVALCTMKAKSVWLGVRSMLAGWSSYCWFALPLIPTWPKKSTWYSCTVVKYLWTCFQAAGCDHVVDANEVEEGDIDNLVSTVKEDIDQVICWSCMTNPQLLPWPQNCNSLLSSTINTDGLDCEWVQLVNLICIAHDFQLIFLFATYQLDLPWLLHNMRCDDDIELTFQGRLWGSFQRQGP